MTVKCRLEITKGEPVRYISHLDYARAVERALRRAKLPVAYSEGFNPHMKMAFASALPVGVVSEAEYLDIEFAGEELAAETVAKALAGQLPPGIALKRARLITPRHVALMAVVRLAVFRVDVPLRGGEAARDAAADAVARFNAAEAVPYVKVNPKGKREIDVKNFIAEAAELSGEGGQASLRLAVRITPTGSIKPAEVLEVLVDAFGFPANPAAALICRTGLFAGEGAAPISPIEIN